jgi:4-hydroxybenzoyl-CoA thioesterase
VFVNLRPITIEWGDCDPAGIVFYPRYFAYFDAATAALIEQATGMTKQALRRTYDMVGFPMVDTRARFLLPCSFGDQVVIESQAAAFRTSSFDIRHRLLKAGALAVEGFETRVWTGRHPDDPDRLKAKPIPQAVVDRLSHQQGDA